MPFFNMPNSLSSVTQAVAPLNDRFQFPGRNHFTQESQIIRVSILP